MKSSTKVKDEHLPDIAVQKYVLEGAGLAINKSYLMHVNRECAYPDLSNLFTVADTTDLIENEYSLVEQNIQHFHRIILQSSESNTKISYRVHHS